MSKEKITFGQCVYSILYNIFIAITTIKYYKDKLKYSMKCYKYFYLSKRNNTFWSNMKGQQRKMYIFKSIIICMTPI